MPSCDSTQKTYILYFLIIKTNSKDSKYKPNVLCPLKMVKIIDLIYNWRSLENLEWNFNKQGFNTNDAYKFSREIVNHCLELRIF